MLSSKNTSCSLMMQYGLLYQSNGVIKFGPRQANLIFIAYASSEGSTLTKDNTTSNNTSNSSKPRATQFSIGSFELVY